MGYGIKIVLRLWEQCHFEHITMSLYKCVVDLLLYSTLEIDEYFNNKHIILWIFVWRSEFWMGWNLDTEIFLLIVACLATSYFAICLY